MSSSWNCGEKSRLNIFGSLVFIAREPAAPSFRTSIAASRSRFAASAACAASPSAAVSVAVSMLLINLRVAPAPVSPMRRTIRRRGLGGFARHRGRVGARVQDDGAGARSAEYAGGARHHFARGDVVGDDRAHELHAL